VPVLVVRRVAAGLLAGLLALLATGAPATQSQSTPAAPSVLFARTLADPPGTKLRRNLLAAETWRGGPITTSTGETVTVYVSDALDASVTPEQWAEFLVHVAHGPELSMLTAHLTTLDGVEEFCNARALGCYGDNQLVAIGETLIDGTTPDEVVRHEYGHHIAYNRVNPPWAAVDWGPKYWASAAGVCNRVNLGTAFPGDESFHYDQNPGEAWAETYRLMDERRNGILTAGWEIVSPTFFPSEGLLQAAERDVLQPGTAGHATTFRRQFTKNGRKVWLIGLQTPLDGSVSVNALLPKRGPYTVELVAPNKRTVLRRGISSGARTKRLAGNVCGQRSLYVRVTERGATGRVSLTVATP
jgi:hypothetical protein